MRNLALLAVAIGGLGGCVSSPQLPYYGNFLQNPDASHGKRIADDVVKELAVLYPPARTRFNLQHPTPDIFGTALVAKMRARGYALLESTPAADVPKPTGTTSKGAADGPTPAAMSLSYVLDQPENLNLYRVTLVISNQSLSRVYQTKENAVYPAGYWVRKE